MRFVTTRGPRASTRAGRPGPIEAEQARSASSPSGTSPTDSRDTNVEGVSFLEALGAEALKPLSS